MADFSTDLAERCVQGCVDPKGEDFIHIRDRSAVAVLSVSPREVHCPIGGALPFVRGALAGLVDAGIEEGRRQAGATTPETFEAPREVERAALLGELRAALGLCPEDGWRTCILRARTLAASPGHSPEALAAAREEGRRLGWAEALAAVAGEATRRRGAYELRAEAAERARGEWVTAEVVRDVLAAAAPGGER